MYFQRRHHYCAYSSEIRYALWSAFFLAVFYCRSSILVHLGWFASYGRKHTSTCTLAYTYVKLNAVLRIGVYRNSIFWWFRCLASVISVGFPLATRLCRWICFFANLRLMPRVPRHRATLKAELLCEALGMRFTLNRLFLQPGCFDTLHGTVYFFRPCSDVLR